MMHIPTCETNQLELADFQKALNAANEPNPNYDITKWLYVPNYYSEYHYIEKWDYLPDCVRDMIALGNARNARWFSAGKNPERAIPITPSTCARTAHWTPLMSNPM